LVIEQQQSGLIALKTEPTFDPLRNALRFAELQRRFGLTL
jgi:hypothetical protein